MASMSFVALIMGFCCTLFVEATQLPGSGQPSHAASPSLVQTPPVNEESTPVVNTCTCGIFLSDQFVKGSSKPPTGYPPITKDIDEQVTCNSFGVKQCINRCVESLVSFMPKSSNLICGSLERDVFKQRAYLFVNNCNQGWFNTKFSAGREFCCKSGEYYKCPI